MGKEQSKLTIGDKVLEIINVTKIIYNEIFKIEDSNNKVIDRLERELKEKITQIIKK